MIEFFLALFSPVTLMSDTPVEGWPQLTVIEHRVSNVEMRDVCVKYAGAFSSPMACSEFNLFRRECHIWVSAEFPTESLLEHERGHCAGFPHAGDSSRAYMEQMVAFWKEKTTPKGSVSKVAERE